MSEQPGNRQRELYRDELNFAEFPLAAVTTTLPKEQKTLEFTDEIFDKSTNQRITRKLTITASDKYGLPTAMDDEVILGLLQLTSKTDFADRKVFFTRYELLKLLHWSDDTRNYNRLEKSLKRWLGVTFYYENSWWSKEEQCWVNEGFHILDQVTILDKERQRRATNRPDRSEQAGKSSFVWNEVVFSSFRAGYLKQIDFEFYLRLESAISKRMYRFLDKRFYRGQRLEFDLRTFACEHIGLAKNYHNGELKRVLGKAVAELEEQGFLKKLPIDERFVRKGRGEWIAVFVRESKHRKQPEIPFEKESELVTSLIQRGVSEFKARKMADAVLDIGLTKRQLAWADEQVAKAGSRIGNPPGFYISVLEGKIPLPQGYLTESKASKPARRLETVVPLQRQILHTAPARPDGDLIDSYWDALGEAERMRIEREIVLTAPRFLREQYVDGQKERGLLFQTVRQAIIDGYVRGQLSEKVANG